jgi:hypothetical protein
VGENIDYHAVGAWTVADHHTLTFRHESLVAMDPYQVRKAARDGRILSLDYIFEGLCSVHQHRIADLMHSTVGSHNGQAFSVHLFLANNASEESAIVVDPDTGQLNITRVCTCELSPVGVVALNG